MLREFKILFLISICILLFFSVDQVYAAQYPWETSNINLSWSNLPANIMFFDLDADGYSDAIYTWSGGGAGNLVITKQYGVPGLSTVNINTTDSTFSASNGIKIYGEELWLHESASQVCSKGSSTNVVTDIDIVYDFEVDATGSAITQPCGNGNSGGSEMIRGAFGEMIIGGQQSAFSIAVCGGSNYCYNWVAKNSTYTFLDASATVGSQSTSNSVSSSSTTFLDFNNDISGVFSIETFDNSAAEVDDKLGKDNLGFCFDTGCEYDAGTSVTNVLPGGVTFGDHIKDASIKIYASGATFNFTSSVNPQLESLWLDYLIIPITPEEIVTKLHWKILDPTLTVNTPFLIFKDTGSTFRLISLGVTAKITTAFDPVALMNNRAWDFVLNDDFTGATPFVSKAPGTAMTNWAVSITDGSTTWNSLQTYGAYVLPSGYTQRPDASATARQFTPLWTNSQTLFPAFDGLTTGLTALSVLVQNAPVDYALIFQDSTATLNGLNYYWGMFPLTADHSATIDLPISKCVLVTGATTDTQIAELIEYGTLCASGAMPKNLIFTQNLAFTFWTLPWGADHNYNQPTSILTTKVRSDFSPFDYTVIVYHSNGTVFNSTLYQGITTNATTFDKRFFNASGADLPSRMEILDNSGKIIYYATIGFPNYFSATASFFSQWFVLDGFNLLYMLPIVFAAMFTRSTVGIGTGLTVAFISVLAWTGIIVIDEIVVYALIFFAILGMLAYRQLRN